MRDLTEKQFRTKLTANGFTPSLGLIYFTHPRAPGVSFGAVFNGAYTGETAIDKMPINRRATLAHLLRSRTRYAASQGIPSGLTIASAEQAGREAYEEATRDAEGEAIQSDIEEATKTFER